MPTSEARIRANRENAQKSTGPKTPEGKDASRRNALKHGMTGAGVVLVEDDAAEVERFADVLAAELDARGELELAIMRDAALCSVRMERMADQQAAMLAERALDAEAEFVAPDGAPDEEVGRLRDLATRRAMFDTSKEAALARQYESAARRGFYKALKELREMRRERTANAKADVEAAVDQDLGTILGLISKGREQDAEFEALYGDMGIPIPPSPPMPPGFPPMGARIDLPIGVSPRK